MTAHASAHHLAPSPPPGTRAPLLSVDAAIDAYLAAALGQLDRVVAAAALVEPRTTEPEAAARTLDTVIETLAGLALGQVIGGIAAQLRTTLAPALTPVIERAIHRATRALGPSPTPTLVVVDDDGPAHGFAAVLRQRVRRRLLLATGELRPVLAAIAGAIATHAAGEERALVRVLVLRADDPLIGDRFTAAVRTGWSCFLAHVEGAPPPTSAPVWEVWARRVGARPGPRRAATGAGTAAPARNRAAPPRSSTTPRSAPAAPGSAALAALGVIVQIG